MQKNINFMKIELLFFLLSGEKMMFCVAEMTQELSAKKPSIHETNGRFSRKNEYICHFFFS